MRYLNRVFATAFLSLLCMGCLEARIKLMEFSNESNRAFNKTFDDGRDYVSALSSGKGILIDQPGAAISSLDGSFKIILEDAHRSGYHRPHWKFHVWIESQNGFPFLANNKLLYAVVFYDGDGEVKLKIDSTGKLHVTGGYDVKDILYPWAKGTIGRGNPYHEIKGKEVDDNGIVFFDYNGFVGFPQNYFRD
jgi:hypothetical protein